MPIKHNIFHFAPLSSSMINSILFFFYSTSCTDGIVNAAHVWTHVLVLSDNKRPSFPTRGSYRHLRLAVGDKVRLWGHVVSVVELFLHEAQFLLAVSVSQRVFALPGSQPPRAGYVVGAVVQ